MRCACLAFGRNKQQVVRQMKEELCYVAFNPSTEEQVKQPDTVYKLPDGQAIRVRTVYPWLARAVSNLCVEAALTLNYSLLRTNGLCAVLL